MSSIRFVMGLAGVVLAVGVVGVSCIGDSVGDDQTGVPMGSLWYPVYGYDRDTGECQGGLGSAAWNDGGAPVMVEPWLGFYCFGDSAYRKQTIDLMRQHDFSWVMISWNGWGDVDLDGDIEAEDFESAHRDIKQTFEHLAGPMKGEFKAALLVEPYVDLGDLDPAKLTQEQKTLILDKIWGEVYRPYAEAVFRWENRPLLVQWFPMDLGQDDRFTIKTFGSSENPDEPLLDWNWYPALDKYPQIISEDDFLSFAPRFDEYFMWLHRLLPDPRRMDPFLEGDVYCKFWKIAAENRAEVEVILIYAWNGYGEQAFIEPAPNGPLGSGGDDGRGLLESTQDYYGKFLNKESISCPG